MEPGLHEALYFENKIEIHISMFRNNPKQILGVENNVLYQRVKFQVEICCILVYTK